MSPNECCKEWASTNAQVENPLDGEFVEIKCCPKCKLRLFVKFRREVGPAGKFEGYKVVEVLSGRNATGSEED